MGCSTLLFIFFSSINLCFASALNDYKYKCVNNGKFAGGSTYQANIDHLSAQITATKEFNYGFYNMTVGQRPNQVNAIGLCRADVKRDACKSCLNDTVPELKQSCPNRTEAIAWSDLCMLRYSSRNISGANETMPDYSVENYLSVFNIDPFNVILNSLLTNLSNLAAGEGPLRKWAAGNTTGPDFFDKAMYAFVQCTPDLSQQQCSNCLAIATSKIPYYCDGAIGCRVLQPSCMLRYEVGPFLGPVDDIPLPPSQIPSSPPPTEGNGSKKTIIVIIIASILSVVLLVILCLWICLRLRKSGEKDNAEDEIIKVESLQYDFATVQEATNNFCDENKLGQGGFGAVYKGHLSSGQVVAVKRLSSGSGQGDKEFKNEVLLVAKLQHRNLVKLLGFCLEGKERLLIYEFVPNASLDHFIFDPIKNAQLDWEMRYKIIGGIARGLLYLHEDSHLRVVHRDLKPSNVLLDIEMNPKRGFNRSNDKMHPYWVTLCSRKCTTETNHRVTCHDAYQQLYDSPKTLTPCVSLAQKDSDVRHVVIFP
ncbi:hypothetical protein SLEP1_g49255 [Rubroshorea leprosula]|uniref:non-specific serine/threonine protein kinase n=1 Tax=Rubroshorea leprosula TaxID=152421 RepID=A0AAV5LYH1_9ROSI|nr:hypothetical protein SLEP1_g49255 [Rubroshorea leprosula]